MADKKTTPSSGSASAFTFVGGTPTSGLSEVFQAMASKSPEEAAESLRLVTMGDTPGKLDLDEEEVVQLFMLTYEGQLCCGQVGAVSEGRFCIEDANEDTGACGKAKAHITKKHKNLKSGWYVGAGDRPRSGALVEPHLAMGKIPKAAWAMLLDSESPMKAPKTLWKKLFQLAEEQTVSLEAMVNLIDKKMDSELEDTLAYGEASLYAANEDDYYDWKDKPTQEMGPVGPVLKDVKSAEGAEQRRPINQSVDRATLERIVLDNQALRKDLQSEVRRARLREMEVDSLLSKLTEDNANLVRECSLLTTEVEGLKFYNVESTSSGLRMQAQYNQLRLKIEANQKAGSGLMTKELYQDLVARLGTMEELTLGPDSRLGKLQFELGLVRARAAGQGVKLGRFGFNTYAEVKLFVETKMNNNYGLCFDAVSLLHSIDGSYVDPDQAVATEASRLKAHYASQLEMKVATSFKTSFPAVMFRDSSSATSSAAVAEGSLGAGMSTHGKWDARDGISGTKYVIENGIRRMEDSIPFEINENLGGEGADLARECFNASVIFVHQFDTFIDMFYLEMCNSAGFKAMEAWELVTAVVVKVFSDLRDARAVAQDSRGAAGFV